MMSVPSRYTRMPSSEVAVNVVSPAGKLKLPVQRAEKPSFGIGAPGPPVPQSWFKEVSQAVRPGVPERLPLPTVSALHGPEVQGPPPPPPPLEVQETLAVAPPPAS